MSLLFLKNISLLLIFELGKFKNEYKGYLSSFNSIEDISI